MKAIITAVLSVLVLGSAASADQAAVMTCTGEKVILVTKSPYLGESSKQSQTLYVLKSKDSNENETMNTAYFLDIFEEGAAGRTILTGKNNVGGTFQLDISRWESFGDGIINEVASGDITYHHGAVLRGKREAVTCTRN